MRFLKACANTAVEGPELHFAKEIIHLSPAAPQVQVSVSFELGCSQSLTLHSSIWTTPDPLLQLLLHSSNTLPICAEHLDMHVLQYHAMPLPEGQAP